MKDRIHEYFKSNSEKIRSKTLQLISDLIQIKTVNPGKENLSEYPYLSVSGDESKAVDYLKKYFDKAGIEHKEYELLKGRGNIIATYGDGKKSLCLGCHLDVVSAGDPSTWNTDPFTMVEKDGKLYGRGVLDNKGPLACAAVAMEVLKDMGVKLDGKLVFAGISGEEFTEKDDPDPGIEFLMEKGHLKPDYAIIPDVGENMKKIDIAEKGRMVIKVTSVGKQAHGSTPELGINAVNKMAQFIAKMENYELKYKAHDILIRPSVNLGLIKGGAAANIVPASCDATFDIRYLPGQSSESIVNEMKTVANTVENGNFRFEVESDEGPHEIDPENVLVKVIQENSRDILGFTPEAFGLGGRTFAKPFNLGGIIAVGFGPGDDEAFHISNEYIDIKQMLQFTELITCVAVDLLGTK